MSVWPLQCLAMATIEITDDTFTERVLQAELPVLVDFWASWCAPCRMVAPALETLSGEFAEHLQIGKVDVDACPRTAAAFRVQSIPTLMLFRGGRPIQAVQGAQPLDRLRALLVSWLPELAGPSVTADDLVRMLAAAEPVAHVLSIVDVRPQADFVRSHLRGAQQVDPENLSAWLEAESKGVRGVVESRSGGRAGGEGDGDGDGGGRALTVLVCRTGEVSTALAKSLASEGYAIKALREGILGWEGSGQPTYSTREEEALENAALSQS